MKVFLFGFLIIFEIAILAIGILIAPKDSGLIYWGTVTRLVFGRAELVISINFPNPPRQAVRQKKQGPYWGYSCLNVLIFGYSIWHSNLACYHNFGF